MSQMNVIEARFPNLSTKDRENVHAILEAQDLILPVYRRVLNESPDGSEEGPLLVKAWVLLGKANEIIKAKNEAPNL